MSKHCVAASVLAFVLGSLVSATAGGQEQPLPICDQTVTVDQCTARFRAEGDDWIVFSSAASCSVVEWDAGPTAMSTLVVDAGARVPKEPGLATPQVRSCTVVLDTRVDPACYSALDEFEAATGVRIREMHDFEQFRNESRRRDLRRLVPLIIETCNFPVDASMALGLLLPESRERDPYVRNQGMDSMNHGELERVLGQ